MFKPIFITCSALLLSACASLTSMHPVPGPVGLPTNVLNLLASAHIPADAVGAVVIRVADGTTVLSHRPQASLQPASTLKILTSIVGLERLGPTYRGRTELRTNGEIVNGTLRGDLLLRGVGNPDFNWEAFQRMLQTLRHKGIVEISGDLIVDRQWFLPSRPDLDRFR